MVLEQREMLRKSPLFVASFLNNSLTLIICPESAMLQKCKIERYKLESWKGGGGAQRSILFKIKQIIFRGPKFVSNSFV